MRNYQKFKEHLKTGGFFYALWRGIKYFNFLIKKRYAQSNVSRQINKQIIKPKEDSCVTISEGRTKLVCSGSRVSIFWDDVEITKGAGLNIAVNTLGLWADSSKADWQIIEKGDNYLRVKIDFWSLPLSQIWSIKVINTRELEWAVETEIKESFHIDELRILCFTRPSYKAWISDFKEENFPRLDSRWHNLCLDDQSVSLVGVRYDTKNEYLPAFVFESDSKDSFPLIQNSPLDIGAHFIGFRKSYSHKAVASRGSFQHLFSGKITLFQDESLLDNKIESFRQEGMQEALKEKKGFKGSRKKKIKVALLNLPWQKKGRWGVRAGSRWPHIRDESETNYLPYPFFLAYATSLLQKYGIDAILIDAIAEQIPEDKLTEIIFSLNFDFLVVETSTPSFYDDLKMLERLAAEGTRIILCGPHTEIYQPQFLEKYPFVDFVLYGEYEFILLGLIKSLEEKERLFNVNGLIWHEADKVIKNMPASPFDINSLPWPYRDRMVIDKYCDLPGALPRPSVQMLASRGCPFGCNFCLWPQTIYQGNHYRYREITDVLDEMNFLVREMKFKSIYFDDDTFNIGKGRMLEFCHGIKERGLEDIPWAIMARADLMDEDILRNMKSAGLWAVKYGVESFNHSLLKNCGKKMNLEDTTKIIKMTQDLGIKTHLTFCFGLPGESKDTIQKTIEHAIALDPCSVQFSILTPFPGTRLFDQLNNQNRILTKDWSEYDGQHSCVFKPDNLGTQDLEDAKKMAYMLWAKQQRKKSGLFGDIERFKFYLRERGLRLALTKTLDYLRFIFLKWGGYLRSRFLEKSYLGLKERIKKEGGLYAFIKKLFKHVVSGKLWHRYLEIMGIYNGEYAFIGPAHVQIDLTYDCNNNCLACWCNSPFLEEKTISLERKKQTLPFALVRNLLDELSRMGTKEIYFSGGGEPFVHPNIIEILSYAKAKRFVCYVNTNFTLLDKDRIEKIVDLGLDHLTVSTWAATAKTYVQTHPNKSEDDFHNLVAKLRYLNSIKKKKPYIKLYNVIFNLNYFEFQQMLEFAHATCSEAVEFTLVDTIPGKTEKLLLSQEQINELRDLIQEIAQKMDRNSYYNGVKILNFPSFLRRISSDSDLSKATYDRNIIDKMPCYIGWDFSRIMPNGDVNACLKAHRIPTGNLFQDSFKSIWNNAKQRDFRSKALSLEKKDPLFRLIGNNPDIQEAGCYKSCDDVERNFFIHTKIKDLTMFEQKCLKAVLKFKKKDAC